MRWSTPIRQLLAALLLAQQSYVSALNDTGLTDLVQWDNQSLVVNGERIFIFSGEFHYQRLPVPELWPDIFQKFKAHGLNAVSIYFFWNYHSPSPDTYDLQTGAKNVQKLLDAAQEAGLYVLARPGPYCNAETTAGGIALWGTDGSAGNIRTADETYYNAWLPWIQAIGAVLERNQITHGGPVITVQLENEYQELNHSPDATQVRHMEQLKSVLRDVGIAVPFTSNEKGMRSQSWSTDYQDVGGAVNIYGLDSYPGGMSCLGNSRFTTVRTYYQWFQNYSFTQPELVPEYAGGWFEPWGGPFFDECVNSYLNPAYPDIFYKNIIAQRVTMLNLYMMYGGTSWAHSAAPVVYTSYDYDAPLRETREIRDKTRSTKLVALFARGSRGLLQTFMESNGSGNAVDTADIWTWVLRNADTNAGFYFAEHTSSGSTSVTDYSITVNSSAGAITIPNVSLSGRQSRVTVSDYPIGETTLLYSSGDILTYGVFGTQSVVVFYLYPGQVGEFAFKGANGSLDYNAYGADMEFEESNDPNENFTRYIYTQPAGYAVVEFSNGVVAYMLDRESAYNFFAPVTTSNPNVKADEQIFVLGPYLVRSASIDGSTVFVEGDNANSTSIEVFTGSDASEIVWNGQILTTERTAYGSLVATTTGAEDRQIHLPTLEWKTADSLPETNASYDDSNWVNANHTTTISPATPLSYPVLFSSDYGFYSGIKLYRGRFDGQTATSAEITVNGGTAAGWSAWLNGEYVGGHIGEAEVAENSVALDFSKATLMSTDNVLTVVTDYHGHGQDSEGPYGPQNPRGILGAMLYDEEGSLNFTSWKIQGSAGGDKAYIDPMRGPENEGGLFGERLGWHLPGFDATSWNLGSPSDGVDGAGVRWYVADVELSLDEDLDVPLGFYFNAPDTTVASIQFFVNGYQFGKMMPHVGPQTRFPVPPGIINNNGNNRIAVSLWSMTDAGAAVDVSMFAYAKYQTSFSIPQDGREYQPEWTSSRLDYG